MNKIFFLLLVFTSQVVLSQDIKVLSNEEIPFSSSKGYFNPILSPTGKYMVVTSSNLQGLLKYDFSTKKITEITSEDGAGFDAQISSDGNTIVYRTREQKDRLRYASLKSFDLKTGKKTDLIKQTRNLEGVVVKEGTVFAVDSGELRTHQVSGKKLSKNPPVSSIEKGRLYMTRDNSTRMVSPSGNDVNYLWNSVSPDGTKLLYYVVEQGEAFVSNVDGSNPVSLGTLRAPKWMGDNWVVGMVDFDNGDVTTSSKIVAVTADGAVRKELTDSSIIALYPMASSDAKTILYNTDEGKVYLMHIEVTK